MMMMIGNCCISRAGLSIGVINGLSRVLTKLFVAASWFQPNHNQNFASISRSICNWIIKENVVFVSRQRADCLPQMGQNKWPHLDVNVDVDLVSSLQTVQFNGSIESNTKQHNSR